MARCSAIKADNDRCKVEAMPGDEWCWNHHPDYEEARRRRASKGGKRGGRSRPRVELSDLKAQLQDLVRDVLAGYLETGRAAVANRLINTRLRAVELERKIRETEELEARIGALEQQKAGSRWGA